MDCHPCHSVRSFQPITKETSMGVLTSKEFAGDPKLESCAVDDSAHIMPGSCGPHVEKVQKALNTVGGQKIDPAEVLNMVYGPSTSDAVKAFKRAQVPPLLNYKGEIDPITGIKTIRALD